MFDLSLQGGFDAVALGTGLQLWQRLRVGATLNRWFNGFQQETSRVQRFQARTVPQTVQLSRSRTDFFSDIPTPETTTTN